jgi:hypothetical protein
MKDEVGTIQRTIKLNLRKPNFGRFVDFMFRSALCTVLAIMYPYLCVVLPVVASCTTSSSYNNDHSFLAKIKIELRTVAGSLREKGDLT